MKADYNQVYFPYDPILNFIRFFLLVMDKSNIGEDLKKKKLNTNLFQLLNAEYEDNTYGL